MRFLQLVTQRRLSTGVQRLAPGPWGDRMGQFSPRWRWWQACFDLLAVNQLFFLLLPVFP